MMFVDFLFFCYLLVLVLFVTVLPSLFSPVTYNLLAQAVISGQKQIGVCVCVCVLASLNFSRDCSGPKTNCSGTSSQWQCGRPLERTTCSATFCSVAELMTREWRRAETISSSSSQRIWNTQSTTKKSSSLLCGCSNKASLRLTD